MMMMMMMMMMMVKRGGNYHKEPVTRTARDHSAHGFIGYLRVWVVLDNF